MLDKITGLSGRDQEIRMLVDLWANHIVRCNRHPFLLDKVIRRSALEVFFDNLSQRDEHQELLKSEQNTCRSVHKETRDHVEVAPVVSVHANLRVDGTSASHAPRGATIHTRVEYRSIHTPCCKLDMTFAVGHSSAASSNIEK